MDHATAHEVLADLALEPRRLARLETEETPAAEALRQHVAACADCRGELDAWRRVAAAIAVTTSAGATSLRSLEPVEPPGPSPRLRSATLAGIPGSALPGVPEIAGKQRAGIEGGHRQGVAPRRLAVPRRLVRLGWLAAAAALVFAIASGGLLVQRSGEADQARREASQVAAAAASLDRILAAPSHWVVTLHTADGAAGGTLAWSPSEVVVLTSALAPAAGTTYRCWIERAGTRTAVGIMDFSGPLGYWAGPAGSWGALEAGSRFGVTAISGAAPGGPAVLVGDL